MAMRTISCDICNEVFEIAIPDRNGIKEFGVASTVGDICPFKWILTARSWDRKVNCPYCCSTIGINYIRRL